MVSAMSTPLILSHSWLLLCKNVVALPSLLKVLKDLHSVCTLPDCASNHRALRSEDT